MFQRFGKWWNHVMASALVQMIGALAAILTTLCWVPQALKIVRDRETRAISLPGTLLCVLGVLLWLVYGVAIADPPLIGSSAVTLAITAMILALKIRHG
jgi:MtN3 and saliva related transmembrane protein